ncbi:thioesterase [Nocardioides sp. HDW12B]|uniref:thioesterase family protein n=1 Tax=Nocardioides sp. HDW12B TaxID=2714939 RepID=UPI0014083D06|nr:hotdog domain-containing protein [Nocardioides sp. HDW12B]QIK67134.1 thioesterase [Nocardioides sp. HDW12B]
MTHDEATLTFTVTTDDTARAVGSGSLEVLGTPVLLAWAEATTCAAADPLLEDGQTTVGTRVSLEHRAASSVGDRVRVLARQVHRDGRLLRYEVTAVADDTGSVLGHGEVTRVVVDTERFLARLGRGAG